MRILHTADWHIGKKLHKKELYQDFDLFIDWLCKFLPENDIDILLVSGDVFDFSNPSSESRTQYYRTLIKLKKFDLKIIITGGNHDSPSVLEAPKAILNELDIHVIGQRPANLQDCLIPIYKDENLELVIAALPYLRNRDLQERFDAENHDSKQKAVQQSIAYHFQETASLAKKKYPDVHLIGMGHLFAKGVSLSDSEREIQIGNLAGLDASHFGSNYSYIALGHIHKPQRLNSETPIFYSGSPTPLSFSERKNEKRILVIDTSKSFEPESISIPKFRDLILVKGSLEKIKQKLSEITNTYPLQTLIEIEMEEEHFSPSKTIELEEYIEAFEAEACEIVKHKVSFKYKPEGFRGITSTEEQISDFTPLEVFHKKLESVDETETSKEELISAFEEILDELNRPEQ
jgi:exonuclease SbcD